MSGERGQVGRKLGRGWNREGLGDGRAPIPLRFGHPMA